MPDERRSGVKNTADEEQVNRARKKDKLDRHQEMADMKFLMAQESGRRFLWRLLRICRMNRISFDGGSSEWTAFNEGHRNVGNQILPDMIEANPEAYIQMLRDFS